MVYVDGLELGRSVILVLGWKKEPFDESESIRQYPCVLPDSVNTRSQFRVSCNRSFRTNPSI